jgi:capsular polysaccharide export protein
VTKRSFLFLQGCTSPFFSQLAKRLKAKGHEIYRINFNMGDAFYWGHQGAWNFTDKVEYLPEYLTRKFKSVGFTDVVMLGDTRPVNEPAVSIAKKHSARIHVLEEGYLRPNWITLEEMGINGFSRLPKDPDWYRTVAELLPEQGDGVSVQNPTSLLGIYELGYHLPGLLNPVFYPGYKTHRPHISPVEFYGWALRFTKLRLFIQKRDNESIENLVNSKVPFYVFPLQLNNDSQIQVHTDSRGVPFIIKDVIDSFFKSAPTNTKLVIKNHPLDTGFIDYAGWIKRIQKRLGIDDDRIVYLESGHMPTLIRAALGVVTINSSVGPSAIYHQTPTIALGKAIYDIDGLTFQGGLDDFWHLLPKPDIELFRSFRKTVIYATQINGGFYTNDGIKLGVENCCKRMEREASPLCELLRMSV